ncbi:MAG: hypothetical protein ABWZ66_08815 [Pyrinomonadaceae bacterium]
MPISYTIDNENRRIYTHCEGVITYEDFRAHMNAEEDSPAASYGEIFDCTDATTDITPDQIRSLAAERQAIAERRKAAPVAIIAANDHLFGMLRMFDILTEAIRPMQVFRAVEAAERWLNEITRRWGDEL